MSRAGVDKSVQSGESHMWNEDTIAQLATLDKLNVGCGKTVVEGWLNLDLFETSSIPYGQIEQFFRGEDEDESPIYLWHLDITRETPIPDGHITSIYASHFIEHLDFEEGTRFLERCYRFMKPGAVIRLSFPDLRLWAQKYIENDSKFFAEYLRHHPAPYPVETTGEIFMSQLHGSGHKWGYDFESMRDVLKRCGFTDITSKRAFESELPDIERLEPKHPGRLLESAYVEAKKR